MAFVLTGCGGLRNATVFQVFIDNDLQTPVMVRDCDSYCTSSAIDLDLAPGGRATINRIAHNHKLFSVTTASGGHLGCLDLFFRTPDQGASVPVSSATPCPGGSGLPWLPLLGIVALLGLMFAFFRRSAANG